MYSIRFEREKMNNYMVMPCEQKLDRDSYNDMALEMVDIPQFMNYEIREIDGEQVLYYKLKYKTSVKQVLGDLELTSEKVHYMIYSIAEAIRQTECYLLNIDNIIWKSNCTFIEVSSGRMVFSYYPKGHQEKNSLKEFLMELLQYVDKGNQQTFMYMMEFYNLVTNPDCTTEQIIKYASKKTTGINIEKYQQTPLVSQGDYEIRLEDTENQRKENKSKKTVITIGLIAINLIVICLLLFEIWTYQYIWVLIITLFLLLLVILVNGDSNQEENPDKIMEEYWKENGEDSRWKNQEQEKMCIANQLEEIETTLLTVDNQQIVVEDKPIELCLKAMNPKAHKDMIISKSSTVIGSMKGGCDYLLKEKGISRMHAKLLKREDGLYLLDLNSTNGTFLNDEQIISGKEYLLMEGDVVALANIVTYVVAERI